MKFNYQIVIKLKNDVRIIFTGVTNQPIAEVVTSCNSVLKDGLSSNLFEESICENLIYQPIKENENETQTQK